MEPVADDRHIPESESHPPHLDLFNGSDLVHGQPQSALDRDYATMERTKTQSPARKLRPIRFTGNSTHELGDRVPELGNQMCIVSGDDCFNGTISDDKPAFAGEDPGHLVSAPISENQDPISGSGSFGENLSLGSFSDSVDDSLARAKKVSSRGTKRKNIEIEIFLDHMVTKVIEKQEQMHKELIEILEKKEKERIAREEAWKQQEAERRRKDEEMRHQEMSHNLALISVIENLLGHEIEIPQPPPATSLTDENHIENDIRKDMMIKCDSNSKRWPEAEVQVLIMLRNTLDHKQQPFVAAGSSVWEEISARMQEMGYDRSAKKCKEKWENMNKYYKKSIESGKKHSEKSKTCLYFQEFDMLYNNPGNQ